EPLLVRSLKTREDTLPADDLLISLSLNNLAELYRLMGRFEDARPLYQRGLKIKEKKDPGAPTVAITLNNMALLEKSAGYYEKARDLYRRALKICEDRLGAHPNTAITLDNLAE